MKFAIVLVLFTASLAAAEESLEAVLSSSVKTLQAFDNLLQAEHLHYVGREKRLRLGIFKANLAMVARANADPTETATFTTNMFSTMTQAEKKNYLGLNATGHLPNTEAEPVLRVGNVPSTKMWLDKVTEVRNQGACGSCWTYGATGGLETRYAIKSGTLRKFSEQEYLDCVTDHDGCRGGWPANAWIWSAANGGRLASEAHYPYVAQDRQCRASQHPDDMIEYKIAGDVSVGASEEATIQAISEGSVNLAFFATDLMQAYQSGIFNDHTCPGGINHAVTGVGYTPEYVLVKNSWGVHWGDRGFIKFARGANNCNLFLYTSHARLSDPTGKEETAASDPATDYDPGTEPTPAPKCEDAAKGCYTALCTLNNMQKYCAQTCDLCDDSTPDGECPAGTVRCNDGECRHEHMCH